MSHILALDQGTTSSRALVFDSHGSVRAVAQRETTQHYPQPGWVEQDPEEIWDTQLATAHEALARAQLTAADITAIGLTNQRETTIVWDRRSGQPVYRAIVWQDRRTASLCDQLRAEGLEALFTGRTGLLLDPYFSGTKIRWILDQVPHARERAAAGELAFGTVDSWLVWKLTGGARHLTDASNASRTLLFNIHAWDWDDKLLQLLRIPRALLPEVVSSSAIVAQTQPALFGRALAIGGIAGDQQAALFGQRCVAPGMVKNTYGTGCFMLMHTGQRPVDSRARLLTTVAWGEGAARDYALEGSVFVAGAVVQWLRDGLGLIAKTADIEGLAASVKDNGGVYLVPAFTGLGAPHWDPYARGTIVGLTRGSQAGHIARAALESIAYQTADILAAMEQDSGIALKELRVDGGVTRNAPLMQFQADVLGVPVVRPRQAEATAQGAAYLAGLASGLWKDAGELSQHWAAERVFEPAMTAEVREALRRQWARAVDRAKEWEEPSVKPNDKGK